MAPQYTKIKPVIELMEALPVILGFLLVYPCTLWKAICRGVCGAGDCAAGHYDFWFVWAQLPARIRYWAGWLACGGVDSLAIFLA